MRPDLSIPISFEERSDDHCLMITLHLDARSAPALRSALHALAVNSDRSVSITNPQRSIRVNLTVDERLEPGVRARWRWRRNMLDLAISRNERGYWESFIDTYVRQGYGDVDHIDLYVDAEDHSELALTIEVPEAAPPLTPAELRKKLGL